jgi:ABC-type branched-subunit amino acid transport system substrate-binding protein
LNSFGVQTKTVNVPPTATDFLAPLEGLSPAQQDALIIFTAQPGCISLAQAMQQEGLHTPVVAPAPCNNKNTIAQAGGGMTGWYVWSVNPDPDGTSPELTTYKNAIKTYTPGGAIGADSETTFGTVMTIYNNLLKPLGPSASSAQIVAKVTSPSGGQMFLGPRYQCGAIKTFPSVCSFDTLWWKVLDTKGTLQSATNNQFIDPTGLLGG